MAKRKLENVFIFPFIVTGRLISFFSPLQKEYRVWYFFPFYHIGGAEKVHAQVAQAAGGADCIIYFTRRSHNDLFLHEFKKSGCEIRDISRYTDNKVLYFLNLIYRGIISGYINRQQKQPVVFNGQCNFAYKLSPWIKNEIKQVELIHSFNTFSYIRTPFLPFITTTIMISKKRIDDHIQFYKKIEVPGIYKDKIRYIPNGITLPVSLPGKNYSPFKVLYVGRGGKEKRVHLITAMANKLQHINKEIQFEFLGDVSEVVNETEYRFIKFYGNQSDSTIIENIYQQAAVVIITSETEGFPMVIMEGMANGCAILATPVGDIPYHIQNNINGSQFTSSTNEAQIINEGIEVLDRWQKDISLMNKFASNNKYYAAIHFSITTFNRSYQELLAE